MSTTNGTVRIKNDIFFANFRLRNPRSCKHMACFKWSALVMVLTNRRTQFQAISRPFIFSSYSYKRKDKHFKASQKCTLERNISRTENLQIWTSSEFWDHELFVTFLSFWMYFVLSRFLEKFQTIEYLNLGNINQFFISWIFILWTTNLSK